MPENFQKAEQFFQSGHLDESEKILISLLSGDINNPEYRKLGEKILRKRQEEKHNNAIAPRKNKKNIAIKKFACPKCSASIDIFSRRSETISCRKCHAVIDLESDSLAFQLSSHYKRKPQYMSFLRVGYILEYQNKKYQIIGRSRKKISGQEWDEEDRNYASYSWTYDEWVLLGAKKEIIYLIEDKEGYSIAQSFIPKTPSIPNRYDTKIALNGEFFKQRIQEQGTYTNLYIEGEFPWRIKLSDISRFVEYTSGNKTYSVEWRVSKSNTTKEVEFFETSPISAETLLNGIQETDENKERIQNEKDEVFKRKKQRQIKQIIGSSFLLLGAVLFFYIYSFSQIPLSSNSSIFSDTVPLSDKIEKSREISDPFRLEPNTIYKANIKTTNLNPETEVSLIDQNNHSVHEFLKKKHSQWKPSARSIDLYFDVPTQHEYRFQFDSEKSTTLTLYLYKEEEKQPFILFFFFAIFSLWTGIATLLNTRKTL